MLYVNQIKGKLIQDAWNRPIGKCRELLVRNIHLPFPAIVALVTEANGIKKTIPIEQISTLSPAIILNVPMEYIQPYQEKGDEIHLISHILGKKLVDVDGHRLVNVNDIQICRQENKFLLAGVDISPTGFFRRLGVGKTHAAESIISWKNVAPLHKNDPIRLQVSRKKISMMRPSDIAKIMDELDDQTSTELMLSMDIPVLADTLEESSIKTQLDVISQMPSERAADILEEMGPDDAADLLGDLPEDKGRELLALMDKDDAEDVSELLRYPDDSAGGIMTTEFAWVPEYLTAGEALDYLRKSEDALDDEVMYYVYILDEKESLKGVISLRNLVMADPKTKLAEITLPEPITINPLRPQKEVAYMVTKYNLLSLPVTEEKTNRLLGIVTVDDALDTILPTAWKKRLPRFY